MFVAEHCISKFLSSVKFRLRSVIELAKVSLLDQPALSMISCVETPDRAAAVDTVDLVE